MKEKQAINPMIILAAIIIIAAICTYLLPAGAFERMTDKVTGYDKVDVNSFHFIKNKPIGIFDIFKSVTLGLQSASSIIFFLLIIGGTFQIVDRTGALQVGLSNLVKGLKGKELVMIPVCVLVFGLVSSFAACCEEYLAFLPLMYVVCVGAGFDSITAVALLFCSSAVGYAGAMTNAFTVGVAQSIAGVPIFSGMGFRGVTFVVMSIITATYIFFHSRKIKKNPQLNTMGETDIKYAEQLNVDSEQKLTKSQLAVLIIFALGFVAVAVSVIKFGFYIDEMAAIFLIAGISCGIVSGMGINAMANNFVEGCKNLIWAGLIIGMCKAITNIMNDAGVMDTIIYYAGTSLEGMGKIPAAWGMFLLQDLINFIIPSGSGQAAITMPFMAPLSDILGVSRQTSVFAFQLGDAFTNVITPTSGSTMAALAICRIPYKKWLKFVLPLWAMWILSAFVLLAVAVVIGY